MVIEKNKRRLVWNISNKMIIDKIVPCNSNCRYKRKETFPWKFQAMNEGGYWCGCVVGDTNLWVYEEYNAKTKRFENYRDTIQEDL